MDYDFMTTGVGNPQHPANQIEVEYTAEEMLQDEIADYKRKLAHLKKLVIQMEELESGSDFFIQGMPVDKLETYIKLRVQLYDKIKWIA